MKIDRGNIICIVTGIFNLIAGVILMLQPFYSEKHFFYMIAAVLFLGGLGAFSVFVIRPRIRFRPGWILPQGIAEILLSACMVAAYVSDVGDAVTILCRVLCYFAMLTAVLHVSAGIQIKCLGYPRWWVMLVFGVLNLFFGIYEFVNMFDGIKNPFLHFGVLFILVSVQFFVETGVYKLPARHETNEYQ